MEKSILITGCSSGIGRCVAMALHKRGYRVFATARHPDDVAFLAAEGLEAHVLDLTDSYSIQRAVDWVLERTGGSLYALFNNGAYGQPGALEDISREVLRQQFETNLFGTHELTQRVIPVMRAQGFGRIIQNSSILGFISLKYRGAYVASKYALEGLSDTLRLELAGSGIVVSLVEPGPILSQFRANALQAFKNNIPYAASFHAQNYRKKIEQRPQEEDGRFTLPPEAVLKQVIHALESSKPRICYPVTFPTWLFIVLKRFLPRWVLDWVLLKI
ncbi:MAG: SDR family oxidoreductase [Magnetococcus sp. DMHC-6]